MEALSARVPQTACKHWTPRSAKAYAKLLKEIDRSQTHVEAVFSGPKAVAPSHKATLTAVLALADNSTEVSTELRFAAIASMAAKKYSCAYAAWDDRARAGPKQATTPAPDSSHAASVLMSVCEEASDIRGAIPEERRLTGDTRAVSDDGSAVHVGYTYRFPGETQGLWRESGEGGDPHKPLGGGEEATDRRLRA